MITTKLEKYGRDKTNTVRFSVWNGHIKSLKSQLLQVLVHCQTDDQNFEREIIQLF